MLDLDKIFETYTIRLALYFVTTIATILIPVCCGEILKNKSLDESCTGQGIFFNSVIWILLSCYVALINIFFCSVRRKHRNDTVNLSEFHRSQSDQVSFSIEEEDELSSVSHQDLCDTKSQPGTGSLIDGCPPRPDPGSNIRIWGDEQYSESGIWRNVYGMGISYFMMTFVLYSGDSVLYALLTLQFGILAFFEYIRSDVYHHIKVNSSALHWTVIFYRLCLSKKTTFVLKPIVIIQVITASSLIVANNIDSINIKSAYGMMNIGYSVIPPYILWTCSRWKKSSHDTIRLSIPFSFTLAVLCMSVVACYNMWKCSMELYHQTDFRFWALLLTLPFNTYISLTFWVKGIQNNEVIQMFPSMWFLHFVNVHFSTFTFWGIGIFCAILFTSIYSKTTRW